MGSTLIFQQTHERANPDSVGCSVWKAECILPNLDRWIIPDSMVRLKGNMSFSPPMSDRWVIPVSVGWSVRKLALPRPCSDRWTIPVYTGKQKEK